MIKSKNCERLSYFPYNNIFEIEVCWTLILNSLKIKSCPRKSQRECRSLFFIILEKKCPFFKVENIVQEMCILDRILSCHTIYIARLIGSRLWICFWIFKIRDESRRCTRFVCFLYKKSKKISHCLHLENALVYWYIIYIFHEFGSFWVSYSVLEYRYDLI